MTQPSLPAPPHWQHAAPHPTFTNAHAQMCAAITALTDHWGDAGQELVRRAYRRLGHETGRHMVESGVVPAGADLEVYGRVSEQIMDTCGLEGWARVPTAREEHRTVVPGCAAYLPLFEFLDAPDNICSLPFEWDNGCLDVINEELEVWPRSCAYRDGSTCHYVIEHKDRTTTGTGRTTEPPVSGVAVRNEPTWTNPTAGLVALVGSAATELGPEALKVLEDGLRDLGRRAGEAELQTGSALPHLLDVLARRYAAAGFVDVRTRIDVDGNGVLTATSPYLPVIAMFDLHGAVSAVLQSYDEGWAEASQTHRLTVVRDSWLTPGEHELALSELT